MIVGRLQLDVPLLLRPPRGLITVDRLAAAIRPGPGTDKALGPGEFSHLLPGSDAQVPVLHASLRRTASGSAVTMKTSCTAVAERAWHLRPSCVGYWTLSLNSPPPPAERIAPGITERTSGHVAMVSR